MADIFTGVRVLEVKQDIIAQIYQEGYLSVDFDQRYKFVQNEYVVIKDISGEADTIITKCIDEKLIQIPAEYKLKAANVSPKNKEQQMALDALLDDEVKVVVLTGRAGSGKAQPLDSNVLTPNGFVKMGDLQIEDYVLTPQNKKAKIIGIFPQGKKDIYQVIFHDGTSTECCGDHLWLTKTSKERDGKKPGQIRTLKEIKKTLRYSKNNKRNHSIPMVEALDIGTSKNLIDPYLMGCILGDGGISIGSCALTTADPELLDLNAIYINNIGCKLNKTQDKYTYNLVALNLINGTCPANKIKRINSNTNDTIIYNSVKHASLALKISYSGIYKAIKSGRIYKNSTWSYIKNSKPFSNNPIKNELIKLNCFGCTALTKFIPSQYLYGSFQARVALLQGLMDTDGTVENNGTSTYLSTSSIYLKNNFKYLAESLGCKVTVRCKTKPQYRYKGKIETGNTNYIIRISCPNTFEPFRLKRKLELYKPKTKYQPTRYIDEIKYIGKKQAQCILIDDPTHLYVTDNFIVTHNTLMGLAAALQKMDDQVYKKIILTRPMSWVGKHGLGALPGDVDDKFKPYLQNYMCNIEHLLGDARNNIDHLIEHYCMEFIPIQLIRGASWANSFIIADEVQVLDYEEMLTLGTRVGENSKLIIMGDLNQRDEKIAKEKTGIYRFAQDRKSKESKIVSFIELQKCVRSDVARLFADIFEE